MSPQDVFRTEERGGMEETRKDAETALSRAEKRKSSRGL